jgi:hypothetical protein
MRPERGARCTHQHESRTVPRAVTIPQFANLGHVVLADPLQAIRSKRSPATGSSWLLLVSRNAMTLGRGCQTSLVLRKRQRPLVGARGLPMGAVIDVAPGQSGSGFLTPTWGVQAWAAVRLTQRDLYNWALIDAD